MLSDYCNIFAEKTNRIGRNVESFVQSRALFARRSTDDHHPCSSTSSFSLSRAAVHRRSCNGDAVNYSRFFNPADEEDEDHDRSRRSRRSFESSAARSRRDDVYPPSGGMEMQQRRVGYGGWREEAAAVSTDLNARCSKGRRVCSSTLPRRTINFRDQPIQGPLESRLAYPRRSLQDVSDLDELDDGRGDISRVAGSLAEGGGWRRGDNRILFLDEDVGWHRRRGYSSREERLEDDYLRLYRSLSRLSKYPQGGKYEPGQVHYERECRTFGKDTVAFIYYKTCYL